MDYVEKRRKKSYEKWWHYSAGGAFLEVYGTIAAIVLFIGLICTIGVGDAIIAAFLIGFLYLIGWGAVKIIRWILGR
jgi:hypothetical protein